MPDSSTSAQLGQLLAGLRAGDRSARDELLRQAAVRLERLTRHMLRGYPGVRRWAETDDVLQGALLRLLRALDHVQPSAPRDFLALAALEIRRELLDLARHFFGPQGMGAHHASQAGTPAEAPPHDRADWSHEPARLAQWCEFHETVGRLPDDERAVMDLLFYQGLSQTEAADLLGVSVRTLQRRWQSALVRLHDILKDGWPG